MKKTLANVLLCTALLLMFATPVIVSADDAGPRLAETWVMTVKAGHGQAFEAAFKSHGAVRAEHEDPQTWNVYTPVTGDELGTYVIRDCCFGWGDLDAYGAWGTDNPEVMADWFENVDEHVESYAHYFYEMDPANSHWPADGGPYRYIGITDWSLLPGKEAQFNQAKKKISQIAINNGWATDERAWGWTSRIGGKPIASLAVPYENFAGMVPGEESFFEFLTRHLGSAEAAAEVFDNFSAATRSSRYSIWAHRPDLSMSHDD